MSSTTKFNQTRGVTPTVSPIRLLMTKAHSSSLFYPKTRLETARKRPRSTTPETPSPSTRPPPTSAAKTRAPTS